MNIWTKTIFQIFCLHWVGLTIIRVGEVCFWWAIMWWSHSRPRSWWGAIPCREYPRLRSAEARIPFWRLPLGDYLSACTETRLVRVTIDKFGNNTLTRKALSRRTTGHFRLTFPVTLPLSLPAYLSPRIHFIVFLCLPVTWVSRSVWIRTSEYLGLTGPDRMP